MLVEEIGLIHSQKGSATSYETYNCIKDVSSNLSGYSIFISTLIDRLLDFGIQPTHYRYKLFESFEFHIHFLVPQIFLTFLYLRYANIVLNQKYRKLHNVIHKALCN